MNNLEDEEIPTITEDDMNELMIEMESARSSILNDSKMIDHSKFKAYYKSLSDETEDSYKQMESDKDEKNMNTLNLAKEKLQTLLDLSNEQANQVDDITNAVSLRLLDKQMNHKLNELTQIYGDDVIQTTREMLHSYSEEYKFKIIDIYESPNIHIIKIQFNIDTKGLYSVKLHIDIFTHKLINIETNIYPVDKLLQWVNYPGNTLLQLLVNLEQTLRELLTV